MKKVGLYSLWALCLVGGLASCAPQEIASSEKADGVPVHRFEVVATYPHDPRAFTQGLQFYDGVLYESTGLHGRSSLREVDYATGRVRRRVELPARYFGEGIAVVGDRIYMLTWREQTGFIFDRHTFRQRGRFTYDGEGWGLAWDGTHLVMSDGTPQLRWLDLDNFEVVRILEVTADGEPVGNLNELAWIEGALWANIFQSKRVARIDPQSGAVRAWIDFQGIRGPDYQMGAQDVFNGIAYDAATGRILVTGKNWPYLYEVEIRP